MPDKKKKKNILISILKIIAVILVFSFLAVMLTAGVVMYMNSPVQSENIPSLLTEDGIRKSEDGNYYLEVRRGESSQSVGLRLERAGLIRSRYFWNLLSRVEKEHIKNGTYIIEVPISQIAIYRLLVSGKQTLYRVTIPEGVTLKKIASLFEEAEICSSQDFFDAARDRAIIDSYRIPNETMEGYLFPDTYMFQKDYPAAAVVRTMADNFYNRIESIDPSVINMSAHELNEKVILASIIEREYRVSDEAPLMAGVFYNRLRINMALQSCATVEYIITEIQGKPHPKIIYNQDLEIQNPYNTYIRAGLPPGPISAPGIIALRAAFFPEKTDFFYFRLNDPASGRHYFSRTLDEHIRAGALITKSQS